MYQNQKPGSYESAVRAEGEAECTAPLAQGKHIAQVHDKPAWLLEALVPECSIQQWCLVSRGSR